MRCIHRNSDIASYLLQIDSASTTESANSHNQDYEFTGLNTYTNYSIKVAAENVYGDTGPFSESTTTETHEDGETAFSGDMITA